MAQIGPTNRPNANNKHNPQQSGVGLVAVCALIVLGLLRFFGGAGFWGVWIAFIGWFLLSAARASYAELELRERVLAWLQQRHPELYGS